MPLPPDPDNAPPPTVRRRDLIEEAGRLRASIERYPSLKPLLDKLEAALDAPDEPPPKG